MKKTVLVSNDDGYQAKGINALVDMLEPLGLDIIVCAPESARSGQSRAFSVSNYLTIKKRLQRDGLAVYSCSGTPVDCIKIALSEICTRKPDLVVSGINHGDNGSVNTHYSGTMGACMEGCMKHIPSIAFSLCDHDPDADFSLMTPYVRKITQAVLDNGLPDLVCLNVNCPATNPNSRMPDPNGRAFSEYKGIKVARMAKSAWYNEVVKCQHPRNFPYYWLTGSYSNDEPQAEDTDNWAVNNGYVAITPTKVDVTAYEAYGFIKDILHI
ncbi:MAG: 5'/3'-nucleotidase SurE [Bacteroidaceae bacterium]|nr:5'/3'-nucleotidase SurE [Bacteroidaceae bacterium]